MHHEAKLGHKVAQFSIGTFLFQFHDYATVFIVFHNRVPFNGTHYLEAISLDRIKMAEC